MGGSDVSGDPRAARQDGRAIDQLRPVSFERDYTVMAPGSVLVTFGQTKVLCTASVEERVPPWMRGTGRGWVTAEYSMLPGSTPERASREAAKGKQSGRTQEIQRLIAALAACGVRPRDPGRGSDHGRLRRLQADGGTRTASICGAYVALHDACTRLVEAGTIGTHPLTDSVAAVSVGIIDGVPMLDLPYAEDSRAEVDMNVVMTGAGRFVEVQGTAEGMAFTRERARQPARAGRGRHQGADEHAVSGAGRAAASAVSDGGSGVDRPAAPRGGVGQSGQGQGDRRHPLDRDRRGARTTTGRRARRRGGRGDPVRQRPPEGACTGCRDRRSGGGRRHRPRGRCVGRCAWCLQRPLRRRGCDLRRQRGQAAARAGRARGRRRGAAGLVPHRCARRLSRRFRSVVRGRPRGIHRHGAARRQRLRLRPGVRPGPGRKAGTEGPLPRWPRPTRTPSRTAGAPSARWPNSSPGTGNA